MSAGLLFVVNTILTTRLSLYGMIFLVMLNFNPLLAVIRMDGRKDRRVGEWMGWVDWWMDGVGGLVDGWMRWVDE